MKYTNCSTLHRLTLTTGYRVKHQTISFGSGELKTHLRPILMWLRAHFLFTFSSITRFYDPIITIKVMLIRWVSQATLFLDRLPEQLTSIKCPYFVRSWQLPYLNQCYGLNRRTNYFMTKSLQKICGQTQGLNLTSPTLSMKLTGAWWSVFGRAHRGSTVGFRLLQRFSVGFAVEYSSCFISVISLDL